MQITGVPCCMSWFAMAAARCVFPVPFGPVMNRPLRPGSALLRGSLSLKASAYAAHTRRAFWFSPVGWNVSKVRRRKRALMPLSPMIRRTRARISSASFASRSARSFASRSAVSCSYWATASGQSQRSGPYGAHMIRSPNLKPFVSRGLPQYSHGTGSGGL